MATAEIPNTDVPADRQAALRAIVKEELQVKWAETDRHRSGALQAPNYNGRFCTCGWEAPRASKHYGVSVGLHIKAAHRRADKECDARIDARIKATRTFTTAEGN